jgi:hypothetical protein
LTLAAAEINTKLTRVNDLLVSSNIIQSFGSVLFDPWRIAPLYQPVDLVRLVAGTSRARGY